MAKGVFTVGSSIRGMIAGRDLSPQRFHEQLNRCRVGLSSPDLAAREKQGHQVLYLYWIAKEAWGNDPQFYSYLIGSFAFDAVLIHKTSPEWAGLLSLLDDWDLELLKKKDPNCRSNISVLVTRLAVPIRVRKTEITVGCAAGAPQYTQLGAMLEEWAPFLRR